MGFPPLKIWRYGLKGSDEILFSGASVFVSPFPFVLGVSWVKIGTSLITIFSRMKDFLFSYTFQAIFTKNYLNIIQYVCKVFDI